MATDQRPRRREDFRIAVLCALSLEYNAATLAFDEFFDEDGDKFGRARGDPNRYTTGRIGKYNVVMALLPGMGTVSSASAMASFRSSYTELKLALLVGICGGVPSPGTEKEVLLGDVIISKRVVQYDFGRQNPHRFATKDTLSDSLGRPNKDIRSLLASLETERSFECLERRTAEILTGIQQTAAHAGRKRTRYPYPGAAQDGLFSPDYEHRHRDDADCGCDDTWICDTAPDASCIELECDKSHLVLRESLEIKKKLEREGNAAEAQKPHILIGSVGSGNAVMKSGAHRDEIAQRNDLIAFEMEAAGAWDEVPCVVIKGVCDYADSHKNKKWQTFAAATAASSMKALLELYIQTDLPGNSRTEFTTQRINEILTWISKEPYEQHHTLNKSEVLEGTGKWLLEDEVFQSWKNTEASSILWLHGIPGSGKSKLTSIVVEDALQSSLATTVYFYCSRNPAEPGRSNPTSIVASIARQLAMPQPGTDILDAAAEAYTKFEEKAFASQSLTLDQSQELIHKLLDSYEGQTIAIIIDALDECNRDSRQDLLDFLVSLLKAPATLKVFVSSRDDRDIVNELDQYENLYLSSERNSGDIELFVRSETTRLVKKNSLLRGSSRKKDLRERIIHELISNAHGMFRWASLHIQELCRQATDAAVEERLVKMPRTLEGLYREILANIESRDTVADRELAKNAFRWLLCAQEQFTSEVFLEIVSRAKHVSTTTISRDQLLDLCNNMVLFDETLDAFRFSHLSVREFLEGEDSYRMTTAHALAAEQCLLNLAKIPSRIIMPLKPISEYSSFFWADHAKYAGHEERQSRLAQILTNFFSGEHDPDSVFRRWYNFVVSNDYATVNKQSYSSRFEKFEAVVSYPPSVMLVICKFDLSGVIGPQRWRDLAQARPRSLDGATHEELTIRYGSISILQWHFDIGIPFNLTPKHVQMAAENEENGASVMLFLLERFSTEIEITQEVVKAAASNKGCGDIILAHLIDKRGSDIGISDVIVGAALRNISKGVNITKLLFKRYHGQISITPDLILAAIETDADVLKLLLDECGDEIDISADLVLRAATESRYRLEGFFKPILLLLLETRRNHILINEDFIISFAENCGRDIMTVLLDECEDDIQITGELVAAVTRNAEYPDELMVLLLERLRFKPALPDDMMETIVKHFNDTVVRRFIDIYGDTIKITNKVVKAAVGNTLNAEYVMALLLEEYGDEIQITEDIIEAVFDNPYRREWIMELLLNERWDEIRITEKFISMTIQSGEDMLALILDEFGDEICITDGIMEEIINSCSGAAMITTIMRKGGEYQLQVNENLLLIAAEQVKGITRRDRGLLHFLLDQRMEEVQITEEVISAAAGNHEHGFRFIKLLIDRCPNDVFITERVLRAAARNHMVMAFLLDWRGDCIRITESVVQAALERHTVMEVLFAARGDRLPIPENALVFAGEGYQGHKTVRTLLERRGDNIQITEEAVSVAVENPWCGAEILDVFLETYADDIPITNGIVRRAAGNNGCGDKIMSSLLKKRRDDIQITGDVLLAAAHNPKCGHGTLAAIFDTPGILNEEDDQISEALERSLYEASRLGHMDTVEVLLDNNTNVNARGHALQAASFAGHCKIVQMLLRYHADANTRSGFFGYALHAASASGNLQIMHILLQNGADVNARGGAYNTALQAASYHGREDAVRLLLDNDANVHIQGGIDNNALYAASLRGHIKVVEMLLENKANVNTRGGRLGNALQVASSEGHLEIAQTLLENGADASCDNGFYGGSIQAASANGHVEMLSLLHGKYSVGLDCSNPQFGRTALSYAAGSGHSSVIELLLADANVRPSSKDHMGRTPLFFAAQKGHVEIFSTLAEQDPSAIDWKDRYGSTPLSVAARGGHIAVVRTLLAKYDVDIDSQDCFGRTPLLWARRRKLAEISLLIETAKKGDLPPEDLYFRDTDSQLSLEDVITTGTPAVLDCDICTLSISENDTCYQCPDCNGGDFHMCKDCFDDCGSCLETCHELTMTVAETPFNRAKRLLQLDPPVPFS